MDHPFFDSSSFPWTRADAAALHSILLELVTRPQDIIGVYERSGGVLASLNPNQAPGDLWRDVLTKLANAKLMRPCCAQLAGFPPLATNERFRATVQDVVDAVSGAELPTVEGVPVVDREDLRGKLVQLGPDASPLRVLVVRGDAKSGKSHGRHLFQRRPAITVPTALYLGEGMVFTVEEVVQWLFMALGALDGSQMRARRPVRRGTGWSS